MHSPVLQLPRRKRRAPFEEWVTLRFAFPDDALALARLAALDSAGVPTAPVLVAEVSGELRAALSLSDGAAVADPFHPSTALLELLHARAAQLAGDGERVGRRRRRLALASRRYVQDGP
ncbi:MAG TPA: hypothetical protein VMU39_24885 [Solirubrobacteraceae bacterium]|nr:hypothetical protein [Solirubrobacteraceae bacterium]